LKGENTPSSAIEAAADYLIAHLIDELKAIKEARNACTEYGPRSTLPYVDAIRFFSQLSSTSKNRNTIQTAAAVVSRTEGDGSWLKSCLPEATSKPI